MRLCLFPLAFAGVVTSLGCVSGSHYHEERYREERVEIIEPPPTERVYIYERGYPPGTYRHGDQIWYDRRPYRQEVFVTEVVNVNVRNNRYVNVNENRSVGRSIEESHVRTYAASKRGVAETHVEHRSSDGDHKPAIVAGRAVPKNNEPDKGLKASQVTKTTTVEKVEPPKKKKKDPKDPNEK